MAFNRCGNCSFRKKYDKSPGSLLGRLWRWHANWCPEWKVYMKSLPEEERIRLADRYHLTKYK